MNLSSIPSGRLRRLINNKLIEEAMVERHLAIPLVPQVSPPTVNRILTDNILLHVGGGVLGFDPLRVRRLLDNPYDADLLSEAIVVSRLFRLRRGRSPIARLEWLIQPEI